MDDECLNCGEPTDGDDFCCRDCEDEYYNDGEDSLEAAEDEEYL